MRSTKLQDALRRSSFDVADRRGNNPHATREAADAEGRRLNGYRYETVAQAERALDRRTQTLGEAPGPPPSSGGGGGNGLFWLLAAGAGIALLSALSSSSSGDDRDDDEADDDAAPEPMRVNPPTPPMPNITVNLTMPHAPAAAALLNPAPFQSSSEPVHITVPIMAPIVMPPEPAQATPAPMPSPAAPLLNPAKRRRKK
jgi:hypothetical protein